MKRSPREKKQVVAAVIAILLALLMLFGSLAPFIYGSEINENQVEISAELGYSGLYKVGYPTPVKVAVTNKGRSFSGEIQLRVTESSYSETLYAIHSYPVELPENSSKQITMDISINNISQKPLKITVSDSSGREIVSKEISSKAIDPQNVTAAVLTDARDSMAYMNALGAQMGLLTQSLGYGDAPDNVVFLDDTDFPVTADLLKTFNMLFISNFDTGRLSEQQLGALQAWVMGGGFLVLGTGMNYNKVMNGIAAMVDVSGAAQKTTEVYFFDNDQIDTTDGMEETDESADLYSGMVSVDVAEFTVEGADVYEGIDGSSLIHVLNMGDGRVVFAAFDLSSAPANTDADFQNYLAEVLSDAFILSYDSDYYYDYGYYRTAQKFRNLPSMDDGMIAVIFIVLCLYFVFIGPVLYIYLKKRDKREKGFVVIPLAAVGVTVLVYLLSFNTIYKRPIANKFNYVDLYNGEQISSYSSKVGAMVARKGDVRVVVMEAGSTLLAETPATRNYNYYGSYYDEEPELARDIYKIVYDQAPEVTFFDCSSWDANILSYSGLYENDGALAVDIDVNDGVVSGIVHNTTSMAFEDVIIGVGYNLQNFGHLDAGSSLEFVLDNQLITGYRQYLDTYSLISSTSNNYSRDDSYREAQLKRDLLEEKFNMDNNDGYPYGRVGVNGEQTLSLYAFNTQAVGDTKLTINRKAPIEFNTNIYAMKINYDLLGQSAYVMDFGVIGISDAFSDNYLYHDEYGEFHYVETSDAGEYFFVYTCPESHRIETLQFRNMEENQYLEMEYLIYNMATDAWETLQFDEIYNISGNNYLDKGGNVRIKMITSGPEYFAVPQIRVEGGARIG